MRRKKMMILGTILLLLFPTLSFAQALTQIPIEARRDTSRAVVLHFRFNRSLLEKDYMNNAQVLENLRTILTDDEVYSNLDSIVIRASASPEGSPLRNEILACERAASVKSYLMWKYPYLNRDKILTRPTGENWEGLRKLVEDALDMPYRNEVIALIDSDVDPWAKDRMLQQIGNGKAFAYITQHMLRYLRAGSACMVYYHIADTTKRVVEIHKDEEKNIAEKKTEEEEQAEPLREEASLIATSGLDDTLSSSLRFYRPIALKTNLLFNLATLLNIEVEIPLSKRLSVAAEWVAPWWLWEQKQRSIELLMGTIEGRYWLNPKFNHQDPLLGYHNPLTGWFIGPYASMGLYDLEWNSKGYQGEFALSAGVSVGYVQPLSRNLNMEFSLSAGFMQTDYRYYNAKQDLEGGWHLIKQSNGTFRWIGPTKAKVSLVWYPHFKRTKKGGKQ